MMGSLRFASLRFASLRFASLRFASLRFASLRSSTYLPSLHPFRGGFRLCLFARNCVLSTPDVLRTKHRLSFGGWVKQRLKQRRPRQNEVHRVDVGGDHDILFGRRLHRHPLDLHPPLERQPHLSLQALPRSAANCVKVRISDLLRISSWKSWAGQSRGRGTPCRKTSGTRRPSSRS